MNKHTPGPWGIGPMEGSQGVRIWSCHDDGCVKSILGFVIQQKPSRELDDETESNARLIAAAPDLLNALLAIAEDAGDQFGHEEGPGTINRMAFHARQAIAKATGGKP